MSINIVNKDLKKELTTFEQMAALPIVFDWGSASYATTTKTYDGEYVFLNCTGAPGNPAVRTSISYTRGGTRATDALLIYVTFRATNDTSIYAFFFEPQKGDYGNYQGFETDAVPNYECLSRKAAAETATNINPQDWTVDHEFYIKHETDESNCYFGIDGAQVANHATNVSSQPYEISCCEPMNNVRPFYLKYPPGMCCTNVF